MNAEKMHGGGKGWLVWWKRKGGKSTQPNLIEHWKKIVSNSPRLPRQGGREGIENALYPFQDGSSAGTCSEQLLREKERRRAVGVPTVMAQRGQVC